MQPRPPRPTRTDTLFPYTTLFRSVPDIGVPGDDWTAFNLGPDAGIALLERANAWLAAQPAREQRRWVRAVQRQRLEFLGMVDFFARHPDLKVPKVLAPINAHYSRSKGLQPTGLGRDQLQPLPEHGMRLDRAALEGVTPRRDPQR